MIKSMTPLKNEQCDVNENSDPWSLPMAGANGMLLRKEVIQPQVPLRLPCYDFTPVMNHSVVTVLCKQLVRRLRVHQAPMM